MSPRFPVAESRGTALWIRYLLCCFVAIVGFRAFMIERYAANVPMVHEWEATGLDLLAEWHRGTLTLEALFKPHNGDHPTVATRGWDILWFVVNDGWDPKLVMITKAAVFAAAATLFIHLLTAWLPRWRYSAAAILVVLFAFPFNWANLIWSIASQFDFLFLGAALGLLALTLNRPIGALVIAVMALFTNGAGPLVAASYVPWFVCAGWLRRYSWRRAGVFSAAASLIFVYGISLHTGMAAPHVGTAGDKAATFVRLMAWPFSNLIGTVERLPEVARQVPAALLQFPTAENSWLWNLSQWLREQPRAALLLNGVIAALLVAPTLTALVVAWRKRERHLALSGMALVMAFAFLMVAATAQARAGQVVIATRFLDHVAIAGFCAVVSCFYLLAHRPQLRRWLCAWGVVLALGYVSAIFTTFGQLKRLYPAECLSLVQRYYATHDVAVLTKDNAFQRLVYETDVRAFLVLIDAPQMQPILPRSITAPNERPNLAAYGAVLFAQSGLWIAVSACGIGAWIVVLATRNQVRVCPLPAPQHV
jgi:hypothetical protein